MTETIVWGTATFLPSVLLLMYFIRSDHFPEPTDILTKTFLLGLLITIPVIIAQLIVQSSLSSLGGPATQALITSFLVAGLCEETFKFLVLDRYCGQKSAFDEPMDGVVYGAVASLGFATIENVLYVAQGGLSTALMRAVTAVPAHACFGAIMGYLYSQARYNGTRGSGYFKALMIPVLIHGLYDAPLFLLQVPWVQNETAFSVLLVVGFIFLLLWMFIKTYRIVAKLKRGQLRRDARNFRRPS